MSSKISTNVSSGLMFIGFLFVMVLLLPRASASGQYLTGQYNAFLAQSSSCPAWDETVTMATTTTIESFQFNTGTHQISLNLWGWQMNANTVANTYTYDWYQIVQVTESNTQTNLNVQIQPYGPGGNGLQMWSGALPNVNYYVGTAGWQSISSMTVGTGNVAEGAVYEIINPSGQIVYINDIQWPSTYNSKPLYNPVINYQNVLVGQAGSFTYEDFYSGAGTFTYTGSGSGYLVNTGTGGAHPSNCYAIYTAENSNMNYGAPSCGNTQCTQTFSAPTGYEGHDSQSNGKYGPDFSVSVGGGWGQTTSGVNKSDLLVAIEAAPSSSATFSKPVDSPGGGGDSPWSSGNLYCSTSTNQCVEIWQAVAQQGGSDTVDFTTSYSSGFTYAFVGEFVGYPGGIFNSKTNFGTSGMPSVSSFGTGGTSALIIAVAIDSATNPNWKPGASFYMMGTNTAWAAAVEFAPGWPVSGSTTAPWSSPNGGDWAELAIAYDAPE